MSLNISIYNNLNKLIDKNLSNQERYTCKKINNKEEFLSLLRYQNEEKIFVSSRSYVVPILQKGPSCGIAALNMAVNFFLPSDAVPFDAMLMTAKSMGLTSEGELFYASNLLKLSKLYNVISSLVIAESKELMISEIMGRLLDGELILVAYDRDCNNEPCLKFGHKAHWGLLTGILQQCSPEEIADCGNAIIEDCDLPCLFHQKIRSDLLKSCILSSIDESSEVYLMHGWSTHTRLVSINNLVESNWQLKEENPLLKNKYKDMVVPNDRDISNLSKCFVSLSV